jgi:hypothetical protein
MSIITLNILCKRWARRYRLTLLFLGVKTHFRGVGGYYSSMRIFKAALVLN